MDVSGAPVLAVILNEPKKLSRLVIAPDTRVDNYLLGQTEQANTRQP
jgi:hypothetical protein